ncbi:liver carboxylesterase 1 precursor [Venturia nashicola]|uniref:Carboxylic ester hydrolase n=1 Tax=Venturia nashicola TaxID=86259 RepID=A0A4Z1NVK7_9PEZI|nr:liver carboxylesterase 1 precursor [Venturia nashicola]TLD28146.1 liver carboxylesterase 1 precursor [Venturia nashicola]
MTVFRPGRIIALGTLAISSVFAAPADPSATTTSAAGPTVTIASGVIVGKITTISNQSSITAKAKAYLGVPFAQSPPERFSPPVAADAWPSPLQAQALKPSCIQQLQPGSEAARLFGNPVDGPPLSESEDCLYLNVYTPENVTASSKKPVMFWIFGGNLQFGSGSLQAYDGTSLAATQDVVVVTFNYRTNIFGFSNSPTVPFGSQNSGFLDQRFALQWVQKNIAQFGGDPAKVLIFGESAGGESVKQLLANPPSPLPFYSAIMESEQSLLIGDGKANYENVSAHFGCTNIQCLRQVSAIDIKNYILAAGLNFPPVNGDGTSVKDIRASISSGKFAKVPIMMGTNLNEARAFLDAAGLSNGSTALSTVLSQLGLNSTTAQKIIISQYASNIVSDALVLADRILTDALFTCTTASIATYLTLAGYSVWRYRFNPSFPTTSTFPNSGAYHTAEIPEVFGTYPLSNQYGSVTQQQIQLSKFMQGVWAKTAKNPTSGPGWPRIGSNLGVELGELGLRGSSGVTVVSTIDADYPCAAYLGLEDALGFSY